MENANNPADGKHVVIQNGQRISGPLSQQEAQHQADQINKINENAGGQAVPENRRARVKQNIFG